MTVRAACDSWRSSDVNRCRVPAGASARHVSARAAPKETVVHTSRYSRIYLKSTAKAPALIQESQV